MEDEYFDFEKNCMVYSSSLPVCFGKVQKKLFRQDVCSQCGFKKRCYKKSEELN